MQTCLAFDTHPMPVAVTARLPARRGVLTLLASGLVAMGLGAMVAPAQAQDASARPVTLVVGFPPGGGVDIVARQLAPQLEKQLGQRVIVENRPGAAATNAMTHVARAAPDGLTLLMGNLGMFAAKPALFSQLPFDPARDFLPVARLVVTPLVAVVPADLPAKSIADFVKLTQTASTTFNFGSGGVGDVNHLAGELLKQRTGAKMEHVPYKGSAPAHVDLAGGQIQLMVDGENIVQPNVKAGRTRALAIMGEKRSTGLPDVPTIAEAGLKGMEIYGWQGVFVPAGTPAPMVARLTEAVRQALADPELSGRLAGQGTAPAYLAPEPFAAYIAAEAKRWADVIKTANIKVQ